MASMNSASDDGPNRGWGNPIAMIVVSVLGIAFIAATFIIEGQTDFQIGDPRTALLLVLPVMLGAGVWLLFERRKRKHKGD
jgi:hypothetical protein